ncbi:MAG: TetR/AcrR family transcriptional regulator [Immundisolibacteraceae bacterium]|nr:TetR/AcrR family transcriptional regulator [Immundisolibacteraceae bacterium]
MNIPKETNMHRGKTRESILQSAVELFAESGFSGVSMRDLARACSITPAALYHHFENKRSLYVESIKHAFSERMGGLDEILNGTSQGEESVRGIVRWFVELIAGDVIFRRLLHRELLDGDEERLKLITEQVLQAPFQRITESVSKHYPNVDANFVGITAISAVLGHFELAPIRSYFGVSDEGYSSEQIADRVSTLLLQGFHGV